MATPSLDQSFTTYQGDSPEITFVAKDSTGAILNLTGATALTFVAKRNFSADAAVSRSLASGVTVVSATAGTFKVALTAVQTAALEGFYYFQCQATVAGIVTTCTIGRMQVGMQPLWTYDATQLSTSTTYQIRRLIGDVLVGDQQLADAEIDYAYTLYGNTYLAGAECCRNLAAQYARLVDVVQGELKTNYSNRAKAYLSMGEKLVEQGMSLGAGAMPYCGGISVAAKSAQVTDPDRVSPQFNIGMFENLLPLGAGPSNELPGNPAGGNTQGDSATLLP